MLSLCQRAETHVVNLLLESDQFPLKDFAGGYNEAVEIRPSSCLEEGWLFPGEDKVECAKANTFMASKGRINDERMVKTRPIGNTRYEKGHFSALERERMLGFPEGYVQGAGT